MNRQRSVLSSFRGGSLPGGEVHRRVHEADVGKRLRKVAGEPLGVHVKALGEQPHIVADRQQPLEQPFGLIVSPL